MTTTVELRGREAVAATEGHRYALNMIRSISLALSCARIGPVAAEIGFSRSFSIFRAANRVNSLDLPRRSRRGTTGRPPSVEHRTNVGRGRSMKLGCSLDRGSRVPEVVPSRRGRHCPPLSTYVHEEPSPTQRPGFVRHRGRRDADGTTWYDARRTPLRPRDTAERKALPS